MRKDVCEKKNSTSLKKVIYHNSKMTKTFQNKKKLIFSKTMQKKTSHYDHFDHTFFFADCLLMCLVGRSV